MSRENLENREWIIGTDVIKRSTGSEVKELILILLTSKFKIEEEDLGRVKSTIEGFERRCRVMAEKNVESGEAFDADKYAKLIRDGVSKALYCEDGNAEAFVNELAVMFNFDSDEVSSS